MSGEQRAVRSVLIAVLWVLLVLLVDVGISVYNRVTTHQYQEQGIRMLRSLGATDAQEPPR